MDRLDKYLDYAFIGLLLPFALLLVIASAPFAGLGWLFKRTKWGSD